MSRSHNKSQALFERIKRTVAGGESSYARLAHGEPLCMARGEGARFWDVDGNEYIDWCLGYGPLILGHRPPKVVDAVVEQLRERGSMYTFPHVLDAEVGEKMVRAVPGLDQVRFANSGTEATLAAMRLARGYTGKTKILKFEGHYHGWTDQQWISLDFVPGSSGTERAPTPLLINGSPSVMAETVVIGAWHRPEYIGELIARHRHQLAAVICEPVMCNCGVIPTDPEWLLLLRQLTQEAGVLLIFDEVITGFRLSLGGAQGHFDVRPDISTFGKALGAGMPVAAFGGSAEVMALEAENVVYHGGTYTAMPMSLAASNVVLSEMIDHEGSFYGHLSDVGSRMMAGLQEAADRHGVRAVVQGYPQVWQIFFLLDDAPDDAVIDNLRSCVAYQDSDRYSVFQAALFERGVYVHPGSGERWFCSQAHGTAEVTETLAAVDEAMATVKRELG